MGRNKYEGSWIESNFIEIDWMLSKENLVELLKSAVNGTSQFTINKFVIGVISIIQMRLN